jgi:hypothetical protein
LEVGFGIKPLRNGIQEGEYVVYFVLVEKNLQLDAGFKKMTF